MQKKVQVSYVDRPGLYELPVDAVLSKREGDAVLIDRSVVMPRDRVFIYPGLVDYDPSTDEIVNTWKEYIEKDYPKLHPRFEILEQGTDYLVVERYDGRIFKVVGVLIAEPLLNIYTNPGIPLWKLIVLEEMIWMHDAPHLFEKDEEFHIKLGENIVDIVGFFAYVAELIEIEF